jgi:tetratricopeptide (TPR) repeat protein
MEKDDNKSIIEYILFNYIITSDIYKKLISDSENNKYIQNNFEKIITHFLKVILNLQNNILKEYKSGMITYSLIIIYNITLFVHKFNDYSILLKLFEFVKIEIENEDKDIISKFVIYYFFILIIINLLNYLEEHSYFHMLLLKNYEIIINLYDKLTKLNNNSNTKKIFEKIKDKKNIIDELINRINKKFKEEGSDWRFNQDVEIIRIINKVIFLPNETKKKVIKIHIFEQQNIEKGIIASNIKNNLYNIST